MVEIAQLASVRHPAATVIFLMARVASALAATRDAELLGRLARGDAAALRSLYDAQAGHALALARRILRSGAEAEEVVQEAFLEVWKRAGQYQASRGSVQAWLLTITRTRAIDRLRSRQSAQRTADDAASEPEPAPVPLPLELAAQRQDRERIAAALQTLPADQRAALDLAYFEGLTHSEIAARTGTPLGTIKTRIRLAMEKLAAVLVDEGGP